MSSKSAPAGRFSLRRWSQRKLETARAEVPVASQTSPAVDSAAVAEASAKTAHNALDSARPTTTAVPSANAELPAIDSLTIDSDFAPFFKPQVDESIKRAALKQLFRDPRFNVMDGLDTYIGDYTQPDPSPAAMLEDLMQRLCISCQRSGFVTHGRGITMKSARACSALAPVKTQSLA